jgi:hypothetical protein
MGYRSEVAYVINFSSRELRDDYINVVLAKNDEHLTQALKDCDVPFDSSHDTRINFYANDVKWYDSYEDVKAHTKLYKWATELYPEDCGWRYIRVGEEEGDIQNDCDGDGEWIPDDDFYTYTSMEVPFVTTYEAFDLDKYLTTTKKETV